MTMKKTELEKRQGLKLENRRRQADAGNKFGRKPTSGSGDKSGSQVNPLVNALLNRGVKDV